MIRVILRGVAYVLFSLIMAEAVLRLFFPVSDAQFQEFVPHLGLRMAPNQTGRYVVGPFGEIDTKYRINASGWNSIHQYTADNPENVLRVAVIGDSYILGLHIDVDKGYPIALEKLLKEDQACSRFDDILVYPFGTGGASMAKDLALLRYAAHDYPADVYVINLSKGDPSASLKSDASKSEPSFKPDGQGGYIEVEPRYAPPPRIKLIMPSALARYVFFNLNIRTPNAFGERLGLVKPETPALGLPANSASPSIKATPPLVELILSEYQAAIQPDSHLVVIMDTDRQAIIKGQPISPDIDYETELVRSNADRLDIPFIPLKDVFAQDFEQNHRAFQFQINDHWNEYGATLVAKTAAEWIASKVCSSLKP